MVFTQREVVRVLTAGVNSGKLIAYLRPNPLIPDDFLLEKTVQFEATAMREFALAPKERLRIHGIGTCDLKERMYFRWSNRHPPMIPKYHIAEPIVLMGAKVS